MTDETSSEKATGLWDYDSSHDAIEDLLPDIPFLTPESVANAFTYRWTRTSDDDDGVFIHNSLAEICDEFGYPLKGYERNNNVPLSIDSTKKIMVREENQELHHRIKKSIRIKFYAKDIRLYAFWISEKSNGAVAEAMLPVALDYQVIGICSVNLN